MADHSELVSELPLVEKMSTQDRLKHAKKRRNQQLKKFHQFEKQLDKENNKKHKKSQMNKKPIAKKQRTVRVIFDSNVMLLDAAARNDIEEVRRFLENAVSPDVTNEDGLTALHQCCIDDSEAMMNLLIEFGANVNARDSELWTPLHAAATCGHIHLCKGLIDKGADLLAVNADGNMPYDICEDETTLDFIESEMAKRGVTQELIDEMRVAREKNMFTDLKLLQANNGDMEYRDRNGATPLHIAAANGYLTVVEFLLDQHVNVDLRDDDSWQAIHAAACWGQLVILEMLVQNGADLDAKTKTGESPLDICEEPELKQRIVDLKEEIEHNRAIKSSELKHRRSQNTRSSMMSNSASSLYSSNTSLTGDKNPFRPSDHAHWPSSHSASSASVRRTSMRDKSALSWKEAREEAKMMRNSAASDDEDEDNNNANVNKRPSEEEEGNQSSPQAPPAQRPPAQAPPIQRPSQPSPAMSDTRRREPEPHSHKTVVIEEMKDNTPTTDIDEVSITVDNGEASTLPAPSTLPTPPHEPPIDNPRDKTYDRQSSLEKERERQMNEANASILSDVSSRDSNHSGVPGKAVRAPGFSPPQGTLADLKKQRMAQIQTNMQKKDHQTSSNGHGSLPTPNTNTKAVLPQNGHSPNLSGDRNAPGVPTNVYFPPPPHGDPPKRRFTATQPSEIVGNDGKQNCCVIL